MVPLGDFHILGSHERSMAVGDMLVLGTSDSLVVGKYNDSSSTALFVVGNGSSGAGNESNAFEVHSDGRVVIPELQGDIPMY